MIESFIEFGKATEKVATALGDLAQALDVVSQTPCFTTPLWKENPSVMISIKPQYCELIASGRKTIEVRKTRPKTETPFKCYIYETKGKTDTPFMDEDGHLDFHGRGQVIGEFICDKIRCEKEVADGLVDVVLENTSCVGNKELIKYANGKELYSWHISGLVIYDKPKELTDFKFCNSVKGRWDKNGNREMIVRKPPQSWCYVEELEDT